MHPWIPIIIYGIIEGITEFVPVSSTAHLLIANHWLPRQSDLFMIVIQSGAVLAVLPIFHQRLHQFIFNWRERETQDYAMKIALAFVITGVGGYLVHESGVTLPDTLGPVTWAILLGGLAFILIERWLRGRPFTSQVTWTIAIIVAVGQLLAAVFPGVSRSGATIMLMLVMGLSRPASVEFSFLVGIPTMLAAGGFKIYKELVSPVPGAPPEQWDMVLLGFIVSAIVSFVVVKWLLHYVRSHTFEIFGWYRVGLFVILFALLYL
jgi:undecaprenyl-diphosphatase